MALMMCAVFRRLKSWSLTNRTAGAVIEQVPLLTKGCRVLEMRVLKDKTIQNYGSVEMVREMLGTL
jgi:hypothetical protein